MTETTATGVVRVVGFEPQGVVVLQLRDGRQLAVAGYARHELAQVAGATVQVRGRPTITPPPITTGIMVEKYDIIEVAGAQPIVGRLDERVGVFFIDTTRLVAVLPELAREVSAKVWVIGRPSRDGFVVTAYGILSRARGDTARDSLD